MKKYIVAIYIVLFAFACKEKTKPAFILRSAEETGIAFSNTLKSTPDFNIFEYMYFYNGAGVGAGDFNNDGLTDLFFAANQIDSKIFINKGKLKFEDISSQSFGGAKKEKFWSTGVSVIDINQDGMLDIYVSVVGDFKILKGHNLLWVCKEIRNGVPIYEEKSKEYGLNLVGFGTQAAFFDYDSDNDLDFFQLNHSVHENGTYTKRSDILGTFHPLAGDKFFENVNNKFVEKTREIGINSSALGYGLGIALGDLNLDGRTDIYVCNDFHENDYLYMLQDDKKYKDVLLEQINHTSRFSMGVDIADLNNDIFPEIFTLDMLPYDRNILKRSEGEDGYYNFKFKLEQGYNPQFARNNLQFNNQNGTFSEIGMSAGIHATDWSWGTLLFDFENDGTKDIFVANGIHKRMNDMDYINFVSNDEIQQKIAEKKFDESDEALVDILPEVKIPNKWYKQTKELQFNEISENIEGDEPSFSNGAIYADLDNDGDLDVVTNNIDQPAFLYENMATTENKSMKIDLKGSPQNKNAIGAKCFVFCGEKTFFQEKFPVRGFLSSSETPLIIGIGKSKKIDSLMIIWADNSFEVIKSGLEKPNISITYKANLPIFDYDKLKPKNLPEFENIAQKVGLAIVHEENNFNEFNRDALIPHAMGAEGPAIAIADINQDGREDIFLGASKWKIAKVFLQTATGKFVPLPQKALEQDSTYEDIDAIWQDFNGDTFPDLVVASGGDEFYGNSKYLSPRLYLNDGKGVLTRKTDAFSPEISLTASVVCAADVDGDKKIDLFLGARTIATKYGHTPSSFLLKNDGKGSFSAMTPPELSQVGFVKDAHWVDFDKNNQPDLLVACEWGGIYLFENKQGTLHQKILTDKKGWWNFALPTDLDKDGDQDIICGNLGLNSRLHASEKEPLRMYVNDYDDNGHLEQIITYYLQGQETIFADKKEIEKQLPFVRKKYQYAKDFAKATLKELLGDKKIESSIVWEANYLNNAFMLNDGKGNFEVVPFGIEMQQTPYFSAVQTKENAWLMLGNFYDCNIQAGLYDTDFGSLLYRNKNKQFEKKPFKNIQIRGQVKNIRPIHIGKEICWLVARNNASYMLLKPSNASY